MHAMLAKAEPQRGEDGEERERKIGSYFDAMFFVSCSGMRVLRAAPCMMHALDSSFSF
jgi:hypothetical protein